VHRLSDERRNTIRAFLSALSRRIPGGKSEHDQPWLIEDDLIATLAQRSSSLATLHTHFTQR
jgi:hypothetical protein